jgi:hypothetical protein
MSKDGSNLSIIKCYAWDPWEDGNATLIIVQEFDGKYEREIYKIRPDGTIIYTIGLLEKDPGYRYPVCIGHFDAAVETGISGTLKRIF